MGAKIRNQLEKPRKTPIFGHCSADTLSASFTGLQVGEGGGSRCGGRIPGSTRSGAAAQGGRSAAQANPTLSASHHFSAQLRPFHRSDLTDDDRAAIAYVLCESLLGNGHRAIDDRDIVEHNIVPAIS